MCTVTFIARKRGYALGMNRDEKLARPKGLPPKLRRVKKRVTLAPSEAGGGTWIAVNNRRVTFALINWYSITRRVAKEAVTRGIVVNNAIVTDSPDAAQAVLEQLPLRRINPFRLIGVFPDTAEVVEWRWDLKRLARKRSSWRTQQWISSGFDEPEAQRVRGATFRRLSKLRSAGSLFWLRRLHSSHSPKSGPFSTCMHRTDAATVSYTEISVGSTGANMRHFNHAPCDSRRCQRPNR